MSNLIIKKACYFLLILIGLIYSFFQHYTEPLDGDLVGVVLPTEPYQQVLEAPLGFSAVFGGERYAATNRYFIHQTMYLYFNSVPTVLQKITDPVSSIYASAAVFKILLQIFLLWLFYRYSTLVVNLKMEWLLAVLLLIPLFQHSSYNGYIGLISGSITYTFFYTLPLALLLWFFLPYFKIFISKEKTLLRFEIWTLPIIIFGIIYLPFSGPLIAPLILLLSPGIIIGLILKKKRLTAFAFNIRLIVLFLFVILAFYSFYLGTFNLENGQAISVLKRYQLLPYGLFYQFTNRPALPILLIFMIGNLWWIRRKEQTPTTSQILNLYKWMFFFSMIYILILPLGGYREYRPYILRMDTLMPINFGLFILYGIGTLFLLEKIKGKEKKIYVGALCIFSLIFLNANRSNFNKNICERRALEKIATAKEKIIPIENNCKILSWDVIVDPEKSRSNAQLLKRWNVTDSIRLYYLAPNKIK